jgi:hypothetical protein
VRNRYLDLLRAAAIARVIVYHLFGWPWLSIVLPAMGVMFALAGSLTAASLRRRVAEQVVASRLRRLLPPLWLLGAVAVPVMLVAGWTQESDGAHPFSLPRLAFWLLPIGDPPGSDEGIDAWEPLWYIRAYVWFVLLSPVLYAVYRRIGWAAVALPPAVMVVLDVTGLTLPDTADAALWDFATYGACWIAGFAHQDGRLARTKPWLIAGVAVLLGAAALAWLRQNPGGRPWDLNDVSESQALWSLAFVLIALRWQPPMGWLARVRPLDRAVNLVNARAVTIYLWHNIAIAAVWPVLTVLALDDLGSRAQMVVELGAVLTLTLVAVLAFGWAEDLAARQRPRLWPAGGKALRPGADQADEAAGTPVAGEAGGRGAAARSGSSGPANGGGPAAASPAGDARPVAVRAPAPLGGRHEATGDEADAEHSTQARIVREWAARADTQARRDAGVVARDLGLPVAGRRVEPLGNGTGTGAPESPWSRIDDESDPEHGGRP